jgi:hypothetical protein
MKRFNFTLAIVLALIGLFAFTAQPAHAACGDR